MRRAIIYTRVSTDRQVDLGTSLEHQRESLRKLAEREGLEVVATFEDQGISAKTILNRPQMLAALDFALTKLEHGDCFLCYDVSRLFRNLEQGAGFINAMKDRGIVVWDAGMSYGGSAEDTLQFQLKAMLSEYDNKKKGQIVREHQIGQLQRGR